MKPWRDAWEEALYGPAGFYRRPEGPAGHFTTSTHPPLGATFATALQRYAAARGLRHLVDIGCGRGELLAHLAALDPGLRLTGVDVVDRPATLPEHVEWLRGDGAGALPTALTDLREVLVVANEWLDVVPCTIGEVDEHHTVRTVLVDPSTGAESLGEPVTDDERAWADTWWPRREVGDRVEIGAARDDAWEDLVARVSSGMVIAVDYGHTLTDRPSGGTLTAYRQGLPAVPVPDGSCDLTAHVAMDSLPGAQLATQHDVLRGLGLYVEHPPVELARSDPARYVELLSQRGVVAQLIDPDGLGAFLWAMRAVG